MDRSVQLKRRFGNIVSALRDRLEESQSLRAYLQDMFAAVYGDAVERAADETGLGLTVFPIGCPYALDDVLAGDFLPGIEEG